MTESSLPENVGTGTVTGKFVTSQRGTGGAPVVVPVAGKVTFTPTPLYLLDASNDPPLTILPVPVEVTLDAAGTFSVDLVATDDTDLNPTGWNYKVSFAFTGAKLTGFSINVPQGTSVDLATVAPVASAAGVLVTRGIGIPDPSTATSGQVVKWNGSATVWADAADDGASALTDLTDVDVDSVTDGQALIWDSESSKWTAGTVATSVAAEDITDASTVGKAILTADDAAAARAAIGAGTSSFDGVYGSLTDTPEVLALDDGQVSIDVADGAVMRLGQKANSEIVWSYNVDQNNSDAIDDTGNSAFKFSMQGSKGGAYDGLHLQWLSADAAASGWADNNETLYELNASGAVFHGPLDVDGNKITGLASGTTDGDAVAFSQLSGYVATSRTVAGHALSADVTVSKSDVGLGNVDNTADSSKSVASAAKLTTARTIAGKSFDGTANITLAASDVGAVPTTRTVNGHALSADVTVSASDLSSGTLAVARLDASVMLTVTYNGSSWPARPTSDPDVRVYWIGPSDVDSPDVVSTGTGGMYEGDLRGKYATS